jgi:hypothetical protein
VNIMNKVIKSISLAIALTSTTAQALSANDVLAVTIENQKAYISGVIDGMTFLGAMCGIGDNQTYGQTIAVVQKFLAQHPERWAEEMNILVATAITIAYNCGSMVDEPTTKEDTAETRF